MLEGFIYSFVFLHLNFAVAQCFDKGRLLRTFVVFDNLTSFLNAPTVFYWIGLNVYMVLGFETPFKYNTFDLLIWLLLLNIVRWGLMYAVKKQSYDDELSIWRSHQRYIVSAPLQVFAMLQGTKAAYDIMRREVDKSWWIDPVVAVGRISKSWTLFLVAMGPISAVYIACYYAWSGNVMPQQIVSLGLMIVIGLEMLWPMCYVWGWTATINRIDRFLSACNCGKDTTKLKVLFTVLVRVSSELILPVVVMILMSPTTVGARFSHVCK